MAVTKLKDINDVDKVIARLNELRKLVIESEKAIKEGKELVKAYMDEAQLSSFQSEKSTVSYSKGKKKQFNSTRFRMEHPKQYEKYLEDTEFNALYFSVR